MNIHAHVNWNARTRALTSLLLHERREDGGMNRLNPTRRNGKKTLPSLDQILFGSWGKWTTVASRTRGSGGDGRLAGNACTIEPSCPGAGARGARQRGLRRRPWSWRGRSTSSTGQRRWKFLPYNENEIYETQTQRRKNRGKCSEKTLGRSWPCTRTKKERNSVREREKEREREREREEGRERGRERGGRERKREREEEREGERGRAKYRMI